MHTTTVGRGDVPVWHLRQRPLDLDAVTYKNKRGETHTFRVYETSSGPDVCGTRYEGQKAVREGFASVWESFPDAQWLGARHFMVGNRGVSEWTFTGTNKDGRRVEVNGCDVFTFHEGKIRVKNSYRKHRPPAS